MQTDMFDEYIYDVRDHGIDIDLVSDQVFVVYPAADDDPVLYYIYPMTAEEAAHRIGAGQLDDSFEANDPIDLYQGDDIVMFTAAASSAPSPMANTTVSTADLNTFVGSGAHDFVAYRISQYESYCIYPVKIDNTGRVTGDGCTTIRINNQSSNRSIYFGQDSIDRVFSGASYQYSDMVGRYMTAWAAQSYKTPLDYISTYILIVFCLISLFGQLVRRR